MDSSVELFNHDDFESPFDAVRESGEERWSARNLMAPMGYAKWEMMPGVIERARAAFVNIHGEQAALDHFRPSWKMVEIGSSTTRSVADFLLSREAAYLVAMNGDPRKPEIAAAQVYFAQQTRRAEVAQTAVASTPVPVDPITALLEAAMDTRRRLLEAEAVQAAQGAELERVSAAVEHVTRDLAVRLETREARQERSESGFGLRDTLHHLLADGVVIKQAELTDWLVKHLWMYGPGKNDPWTGYKVYASCARRGRAFDAEPYRSSGVKGGRRWSVSNYSVRLTPQGYEDLLVALRKGDRGAE